MTDTTAAFSPSGTAASLDSVTLAPPVSSLQFTGGLAAVISPLIVPLSPAASQSVNVTLNNQVCTINVYGKTLFVPISPPGMIITDPPVYQNINPVFLDLYVNDTLIIGGVPCLNQTFIVRDPYLGFIGDLIFVDTQGSEDPFISGLGTRFLLTYQQVSP